MAARVARILSDNVGTVREFEYKGRPAKSAIWKSPVAGRIPARGVNLDGDTQADHAGTPEEMLGIVQAKDLLDAYLRGECPDLRAQVRPAPNVPDTVDALDVLDVIKGSPVHMTLVHDEYGQFDLGQHAS